MLEWNGSYDTLNKYDNEADTTDSLGGYLCYAERTVGRLEVNNTATVRVESGLQQHMGVNTGMWSVWMGLLCQDESWVV